MYAFCAHLSTPIRDFFCEMPETLASDVLDRLRSVFYVDNDSALAEAMGINRQTLGSWRSRGHVPYEECVKLAVDRGLSLDWLLTGNNPNHKPARDEDFGVDPKAVAAWVEAQKHTSMDKSALLALFGKRVRELRGRRSIDDLAEVLGVHRNTLYRIEKGESEPGISLVWRMKEVFGVDAARLLGEDVRVIQPTLIPDLCTRAAEDKDYVFVPHFDGQSSNIYGGAFNDLARVRTMQPFPRQFIRAHLGITHNQLALMDVPDRDMEPLLRDGDTVLLDTSVYADLRVDSAPADGFYVLDMTGTLMIRRLQRMPGQVHVSCEKPNWWLPIVITKDSPGGIIVLGRVVWAGVRFA